jgi:hypothetical protein
VSSPLGDINDLEKLRRDFDAMLDRLEAAVQGNKHYDYMDNAADVTLTNRFVALWWDVLSRQEQKAYAARIAWIQKGRRPLT